MTILPFIAAALFVQASAATGSPVPTAAEVANQIGSIGPQATINQLARANQWDFVADQIGSGNPAWIALAPKLAPGSDAGSAEDLGISLAYALPKNPVSVLMALDGADGHIIGAARVCGMPFIEDSVKDRRGYKTSALRALGGVDRPALADRKAACLAALRASR